ncbi:acyl-CoA carboxylase subunit epsilon [Arthrobacter sp. GMC3]|uniref:acyl-CoA carboxylase subunit epsilon n=1 Tax=Arthrobacter sp. GMC3 TaxID=2058894 RepID=UPI000CE406C6|nr:acyl-CoA carboxylase subunit epsilon [Arthrobacter sp. GMC3]
MTRTQESNAPADQPQAEPLLTVTKGNPDAEELAALTAVVLALGGTPEAEPQKPTSRHWARRAQLNLAPKPGPGAWRRSAR